MTATLAVLVAGVLELAVGEPPDRLHPVAWFGSLVAPVDREWSRPLAVGSAAAIALPLFAALAVAGVVAAIATVAPLAATLAAGVTLFLATSLRRLLAAADAVIAESDRHIEAARDGLLALAGRDATGLSPGQLRSAAVESSAENLADGLVAPLGAFALAAALAPLIGLQPLPTAAGAAAWVKAVNTMDSMLGYRSKRVGTPAARLDDAVMWLPARASALLLAVAFRDLDALLAARGWLDRVPSPNSGWPMGTAAAALGVRLEKPGVYVLNAAAELPSREESGEGVRTVGVAGILSYTAAALLTLPSGVAAWF